VNLAVVAALLRLPLLRLPLLPVVVAVARPWRKQFSVIVCVGKCIVRS